MRVTGRHAAVLGVGAVLVLSFLAVKAESVDLQQHARYDADLVQLKELDTRINADILESRFELSTSYDRLVAVLGELRAVRSALATPPAFVSADRRRDLDERLAAYDEVAAEKESLVEQFKTENAVFRNSLHYLPALYDEIAANAAADALDLHTVSQVERIVRAVLLYNLTGDADLAVQGATEVASLRAPIPASDQSSSDRRLLLFGSHVETILARKPTLDKLAEQLVSLPSNQRANDLRAAYGVQYDRALGTANVFRIVLFATSVVLLACTIFILIRWRRATSALRFQAQHDALTGLANRALLHARLEEATLAAQRNGGSVALLLMDLDRFKEVNDTLGHHAGDELLRRLAARLEQTLRTSDTIARLGGDEFAIVLPGATAEAGEAVVRKILRSLEEPCTIDGYAVDLEASIGVAVCPEHGSDARTLLRHADVAMYAAKAGHTGFAIYAPHHDPAWRRSSVGSIRSAA